MATATNGTVAAPKERAMTYTPFMSKTEIKLSVEIVKQTLCVPTRQGHTCDDRDAVKFMMMCRAGGLDPFAGDAYIVGYDTQHGPRFSMITAHQAFLKRAETHPEYDGMESGVIVIDKAGEIHEREGDFTFDDDKLVGGWATVFFKHRTHPMKRRLKLSTFSTGKSRWLADPAGMIVKCAEADALRSSFPTLLGGMYLEGEMDGVIEAEIVAPKKPNGRIAASDLTEFAKGVEPPKLEPVEEEAAFEHAEPEEFSGELFDKSPNTGA
jgi:phage recombination protein Bet